MRQLHHAEIVDLRRRSKMGAGEDFECPNGFGAELYKMRTNAGFSQIRVARDSSLARGYYGQIENSKKPPPPVSTLRRITVALHLSDAETQRLLVIAATERGASLVIPDGLPKDIVQVLRKIAQKAYRLSPSQVRRIEAAIAEEPFM